MDEPMEMEQNQGGDAPELNTLLREDARLQSQFDRLVSKALTTARGNWEREHSASVAQTAQTLAADRERELEAREAAIRQRELRAQAAALLGARGLPGELADCVPLGDPDALEQSVGRVERAFRQSVDGALAARLAGAPPKSGDAGQAPNATLRRAMGLKTER